jgi:hypothetical protein
MRKFQGEDRTEKVLLDGAGFRHAREVRERVEVLFPWQFSDLGNCLRPECLIDAIKQSLLADQRRLRLGGE